MAARKDDWSPDDLRALLNTSVPKLEARMLTLCREPKSAAIAAAAVEFFKLFPIRFREQLGSAAAAVGVAFLHRAKSAAFTKLPAPKAPNDFVPLWHERVCQALTAALGPRAKPATAGAVVLTPLPTKGADLQAEWLHRAVRARADELEVLLEHFTDGPATHIAERGVALLRYPVDSRIADAATAFLSRAPVAPGASTPAFTIAALLFCVHGNRSHRSAVEKLSAQVPSLIWAERGLPDVAATPRVEKKANGSPTNERDFLRFIAEAPQDDARVATFMDWLLERNDPRGTFISLQRAGKDSKSLLKKHEKAWLGSMAKGAVKGSAVFRGGFVREVALQCWQGSHLPLEDEPLLAFLEVLDVRGGSNLPIPEWLTAAKWPALRSLTTSPRVLERVPDSLLTQLDTLGVEGRPVRSASEQLAVLSRPIPNVKTLLLRGDWREGADEVAKVKSIRRVAVETHEPKRWEGLRASCEVEIFSAYGK